MTKAGKSNFYFGVYIVIAGISFIIMPDTLISVLNLPEAPEAWTKFLGLLALIIGLNHMYCGKLNILPFIQFSIYLRFGFAIAISLFVIFKILSFSFLAFGMLDALGALWTVLAMKSDRSKDF